MVLLDMLAKTEHRLIVAHVDHGIRGEDSPADARFVAALAKSYQLPFVSAELHLGTKASEEQAREGRYEFLFAQAEKFGATVVTAHHRDDLVETIALNLTRGTGWRGLGVLDRPGVTRPLLALTKAQLYDYALKNRLEWVEDATNGTNVYLRNRLRAKLAKAKVDKQQIADLRSRQLQLRRDIDREAARVAARAHHSRYFINMLDTTVAAEVLGAQIAAKYGYRPVQQQLVAGLYAIKTAKPGTKYQLGQGITLKFTARNYTL